MATIYAEYSIYARLCPPSCSCLFLAPAFFLLLRNLWLINSGRLLWGTWAMPARWSRPASLSYYYGLLVVMHTCWISRGAYPAIRPGVRISRGAMLEFRIFWPGLATRGCDTNWWWGVIQIEKAQISTVQITVKASTRRAAGRQRYSGPRRQGTQHLGGEAAFKAAAGRDPGRGHGRAAAEPRAVYPVGIP
jgi:hypothetical protein